jgi:hypothetical protein
MGFQSVSRRSINWLSEKSALVSVLSGPLNLVCEHLWGKILSTSIAIEGPSRWQRASPIRCVGSVGPTIGLGLA